MRFDASSAKRALAALLLCVGVCLPLHAVATKDDPTKDIQLELSPRICTLAANDTECDTVVRATWRSHSDESLCLIIVERPDVKRCWQNFSQGSYSIELTFSSDLAFQLKDLGLQQVQASEILRVIREAMHYRHKRREPWNIFD